MSEEEKKNISWSVNCTEDKNNTFRSLIVARARVFSAAEIFTARLDTLDLRNFCGLLRRTKPREAVSLRAAESAAAGPEKARLRDSLPRPHATSRRRRCPESVTSRASLKERGRPRPACSARCVSHGRRIEEDDMSKRSQFFLLKKYCIILSQR